LWKVGFGDLISDPVNVGSGHGVTISNLSQRVLELTGWNSTVKIDPARQTEVTRFVTDVTRSQRVLGLDQPADPLFGLAEMVDWSRRQRAMSNSGQALAPLESAG
jgi:nucleoside-diphosphate-sugar epimerase